MLSQVLGVSVGGYVHRQTEIRTRGWQRGQDLYIGLVRARIVVKVMKVKYLMNEKIIKDISKVKEEEERKPM